ncbi:MAG: hypothetical protein IT169_02255 [Bryobacterales bacterium]|nr:hypothetical protein [Bryobacterales bacterium]
MRLLIQLQEDCPVPASRPEPGTLPEAVRRLLQEAGATHVRASHPELVGLFTAEVPERAGIGELLSQLKALPEVRHAEVDSFSTTL